MTSKFILNILSKRLVNVAVKSYKQGRKDTLNNEFDLKLFKDQLKKLVNKEIRNRT